MDGKGGYKELSYIDSSFTLKKFQQIFKSKSQNLDCF